MERYRTRYGVLEHIGEYTLHSDNSIKDCMLTGYDTISTEYGELIPQYEYSDYRRKYIYSLSFYEEGSLRRIALNHRTGINTSIGRIDSELILFYQSGRIKRLFPLNGRISAYWEEEDEYQLAIIETLPLSCGTISARLIAISFFEDERVKDLTFWPNEIVQINTSIGEILVRIGISFYPNGSIKSLEPAYPVLLQTPIGSIEAFDSTASGISGESNSIVFSEDGLLIGIITSAMKVSVQDRNYHEYSVYSPEQEVDVDGIEISFYPLKITFFDNKVCFNDNEYYDLSEYIFVIERFYKTAQDMCSDCSSCGRCKL